MVQQKRAYDSSVARMAGNIAAGLVDPKATFWSPALDQEIARRAVSLARSIVAELTATEPAEETS